jgi:uncharacterized membrane protein
VGSEHSLVALAYPTREVADAALADLERLGDEHAVKIKDCAVVVKVADGRIELHQTRELSLGTGVIAGGTVGFLLGLAVGGPIGASVAGMVAGGGYGAFDTGIDNKRLRSLGDELEPGHAALVLLVVKADWATLRSRLAPHQGELLLAELSDEALESLGSDPTAESGSSATRP